MKFIVCLHRLTHVCPLTILEVIMLLTCCHYDPSGERSITICVGSCLVSTIFSSRTVYTEGTILSHMERSWFAFVRVPGHDPAESESTYVVSLSLPQLSPLRLALVWHCFCVFRFGLRSALPTKPSHCDSPKLSLLRLAVCLVVSGHYSTQTCLHLIDRSACLVEPVLVGRAFFCSFPCPCRPYRARPAPRPVAARERPHREACFKVLCSRGTRSEPLCCFRRFSATASSTPSLRALITARCLPPGLVPLPPACLQGRDRLDVHLVLLPPACLQVVIVSRVVVARPFLFWRPLACKLLCCNCHATSHSTSWN